MLQTLRMAWRTIFDAKLLVQGQSWTVGTCWDCCHSRIVDGLADGGWRRRECGRQAGKRRQQFTKVVVNICSHLCGSRRISPAEIWRITKQVRNKTGLKGPSRRKPTSCQRQKLDEIGNLDCIQCLRHMPQAIESIFRMTKRIACLEHRQNPRPLLPNLRHAITRTSLMPLRCCKALLTAPGWAGL